MLPTKGYAATAAKVPLAPYDFERRELRDHDVLIDILYCGVCHSDIHQTRDEWGGATFPMVPGHEITGVVKGIGSKVTKFSPGDKVGVGVFVDSCRECEECRSGDEQYCERLAQTYNSRELDGTPTMGGYADKIVVHEDYVLCVPDNLSLAATAPLLCAGITLWSPLRHWHAGPGKKVAIVGLGGLGHMGVKFGHALGAEVTVLSHTTKKEADAKRLGADHFYATSDPATFEKLSGHFDLILNTVSAYTDWNALVKLLKTNGTMVIVGIPDEHVPVGALGLVPRRRSIAGSMIGSLRELQEMLDFCGQHNIVSDIEMVNIQDINEAYERVIQSDVKYRFVIDMASLK